MDSTSSRFVLQYFLYNFVDHFKLPSTVGMQHLSVEEVIRTIADKVEEATQIVSVLYNLEDFPLVPQQVLAQEILHQLRCILVTYSLRFGRRPVLHTSLELSVSSNEGSVAVEATKESTDTKEPTGLESSSSSDEEEKRPCTCKRCYSSVDRGPPGARVFGAGGVDRGPPSARVGDASRVPVYKKRRVSKTTLRLPGRKGNEVDVSSQPDYDDSDVNDDDVEQED